jgi:hypothetical protein
MNANDAYVKGLVEEINKLRAQLKQCRSKRRAAESEAGRLSAALSAENARFLESETVRRAEAAEAELVSARAAHITGVANAHRRTEAAERANAALRAALLEVYNDNHSYMLDFHEHVAEALAAPAPGKLFEAARRMPSSVLVSPTPPGRLRTEAECAALVARVVEACAVAADRYGCETRNVLVVSPLVRAIRAIDQAALLAEVKS